MDQIYSSFVLVKIMATSVFVKPIQITFHVPDFQENDQGDLWVVLPGRTTLANIYNGAFLIAFLITMIVNGF